MLSNVRKGEQPSYGLAHHVFREPKGPPILALMSWNGNTVDFGRPIEILNYGQGWLGNGTPLLNGAGAGFYGSGEVHGIIRIPGTMTSITFTDTTENWHGFTLGITDQGGPSEVPEPATMLLFDSGLACLMAHRRRKAEQVSDSEQFIPAALLYRLRLFMVDGRGPCGSFHDDPASGFSLCLTPTRSAPAPADTAPSPAKSHNHSW